MPTPSTLVRIAAIGAALFSAHAAFAGDISRDDFDRFVSTKTRAQVIAEVLQARADGTLMSGDEISPQAQPRPTLRTREEVRAEAYQAARFMVRNDFNRGG